jgi:RNA polymerase sigma factor (sigma-70 family)
MMPPLPPRQYLRDKFYTRMVLKKNNNQSIIEWRTSSDLRRNFDLYAEKHHLLLSFLQTQDIKLLVNFWINIALQRQTAQTKKQGWEPKDREKYALQHLACLCEEARYWAAQKIWVRYNSINYSITWDDYLGKTIAYLYDTNRFIGNLHNYNPQKTELVTYIEGVFKIKLISECHKQISDWRLLARQTNPTELKGAIFSYGIVEPNVSKYLFAYRFFKPIYNLKIESLYWESAQPYPEPDRQDFEETTNLYNSYKSLASAPHEVFISSNATVEEIEEWMKICIKALRHFPKILDSPISIEQHLQEYNKDIEDEYYKNGDVEDKKAQHAIERILDESTETERQIIIRQNILSAISSLKTEQKQLLIYYYGFRLHQEQIAEINQVTQSAISQQINTIKKQFIKKINQLSNPSEWVANYVSKWLANDYQSPDYKDLIQEALIKAVKKLNKHKLQILNLRYGENLEENQIALILGIGDIEVHQIIQEIENELQNEVIHIVNESIKELLEIDLPDILRKNVVIPGCQNLGISHSPLEVTNPEVRNKLLKECLKIMELLQLGA